MPGTKVIKSNIKSNGSQPTLISALQYKTTKAVELICDKFTHMATLAEERHEILFYLNLAASQSECNFL